jgi:hypothetical protein
MRPKHESVADPAELTPAADKQEKEPTEAREGYRSSWEKIDIHERPTLIPG